MAMLATVLCLCSMLWLGIATPPLTLDVDFPTFLARSDPHWRWGASVGYSSRPTEWVDSLFGGNGDHGFMLWAPSDDALRLDISLQSLWDDRTPDLGSPYYTGNFAYDQPRLPSGSIQISWKSKGQIQLASGSVSLHRARALLNVTTAAGGFQIEVWASAAWSRAGGDVVVLEVTSTGAEEATATWIPAVAASTWASKSKTYVLNPASTTTASTPMPGVQLNITTQPHLPKKGSGHSSAVLSFADGPKQYHVPQPFTALLCDM